MYDVIVIGGGPAGLQAALTLGRMHRSALVLDSGAYRNGPVRHMHNVIANDGTPPSEFRAISRAQLGAYPTIELRDAAATAVLRESDGFRVLLSEGDPVAAQRIVLATGLADELPDVPGLDALWGLRAFSCPFCDGHEFAGRTLGILGTGARAEHLLGLLGPIAGRIVVFPIGAPATDEEREALVALGAEVHPDPVDAVAEAGDGVAVTAAGVAIPVDGLFLAAGAFRQRAPFAAQLDLTVLPSGAIEIDEFGRTSLPGVSAAGDLAHRATMPGVMASVLAAAAAGQLAAAMIVQDLAAAH